MHRPIEKVLGRLRHANKKIDSYQGYHMAQCPAHDDQNPSLQIKENQHFKTSLKCLAGCNINDVLKSMNLTMNDLYPENTHRNKNTIYTYTDEYGNPLFDVERKYPKKFFLRRKNEDDKYVYNVPRDKRTIYKLPLVIAAIQNNKTVFVAEGEKDADNLIKLGLTATTNPLGAGNWDISYNKHFKGASIVLLPDNDEPGMKHMEKVAQNLSGIATDIKILRLPDLSKGGDISDWLAKGNTKDDLLKLASAALPLKPEDEVYLTAETTVADKTEFSPSPPFVFKNHHIYKVNGDEEKCIANFTFKIVTVQHDPEVGRIYYIQISETYRGEVTTSKPIEIRSDVLDDIRTFNRTIRAHSFGRIFGNSRTQPVELIKWQYEQYNRPEFFRPDYIGYLKSPINQRPFWLFGNALVCMPWKDKAAEVILKNDDDEFVVDSKTGFLLPDFIKNTDNAGFISNLNINDRFDDLPDLIQKVKHHLIHLLTGGQANKQGELNAKLLLGYVVYMLHEHTLYYVNDNLGHTVILYVQGPKGTGKSTVFIRIIDPFFGLCRIKIISGNDVSIPAFENQLGRLSQMPVIYDEFNPIESKISNQRVNGYYHRSGRSVSDTDRKGHNKYNPIKGSPVLISNYHFPSDDSAGEATASRMVLLEMKNSSLDPTFLYEFEKLIPELSRISLYVLMNQTHENTHELVEKCKKSYADRLAHFRNLTQNHPGIYQPESRLIDNYTRLESCYQYIFGEDQALTDLINEELKRRFNKQDQDSVRNKLISQLNYLCTEVKLIQGKHYTYKHEKDSLHLRLSLIEQVYSENIRTNRIPPKQLKAAIKDLLQEAGEVETKNTRWRDVQGNSSGNSGTNTHHTHIVKYIPTGPDKHHFLHEIFPYH